MAGQKAAARAAWKGSGEQASGEIWFDIADEFGGTEFTGYAATEGEGQVVALVKDGKRVETAGAGERVTILTNQTPFYGESGGQSGDAGIISNLNGLQLIVEDVSKPLGRLHAHQARVEAGQIVVGQDVHLSVDVERRDRIRANHSATHLVHAALRNRLGGHVTQKGSLVAADRFRFDFSHPTPLSVEDMAIVEREVNAQIRANVAVSTRLMTPDDAIAAGALALFGEKYGDEVRVLSMGSNAYSVELCGGTHVNATGDIGLFVITHEGGVASGIRRIEALTGEEARKWLTGKYVELVAVQEIIGNSPDTPTRAYQIRHENRRLQRELAEAKKALAMGGGVAGSAAGPEDINGIAFIGQIIDGLDPKELRGVIDDAKVRLGEGVAAIITVNDGKASVAVGVTPALQGKVDPVALVRVAVAALGGQGGGGRPDMAQGGGPDGSKAGEALDAIRVMIAR
jgi:alanyl-tRNA synthetase